MSELTESPFCVRADGRLLYTPSSATYEGIHADETTPNILIFGRRGTAKSWNVRWLLHRRALKYPGLSYMVCRNSKPELERTHLKWLPGEMEALVGADGSVDPETGKKLDKSYASVKGLADYGNGSTGLFVGFEREADALKVLGAQIDILVIEEITTMSWSVVVDLASCLRTTNDSGRIAQLFAPTNPFGPHAIPVKRHWIDQDITEDEEPGYDPRDWLAVPTFAEDNPYLNFKAYDKRLGALSPAKRRAWLAGEWSLGEGAYFDDFEPERDGREWHVISRLPEWPTGTVFYRGLDYGFSPDPAVLEVVALLPNKRIVFFRENSWQRTPGPEFAHEVVGYSKGIQIAQSFCDPSIFNGQRAGATTVGDLIEAAGVPLTQSVNDRALFGTVWHEALSTVLADGLPKVQIYREGCPQLVATLPQMQPNKNHPERIADGNDHYVIAGAYVLMGILDRGGNTAPAPVTTPRWMKPKHGDRRVLGSESVR